MMPINIILILPFYSNSIYAILSQCELQREKFIQCAPLFKSCACLAFPFYSPLCLPKFTLFVPTRSDNRSKPNYWSVTSPPSTFLRKREHCLGDSLPTQ